MAQTATIYVLHIDLNDMDRGVYETLELRVARHPSETIEFMLVRVLAYCLEYEEGIAFGDSLSSGDEPAVLVRDLTGRLTGWFEVGMPDAGRMHRGSKAAGRVGLYTHRDIRQVLGQFEGEKIHRAEDVRVRAFDREAIETIAAALDRRTQMGVSITDGDVFVTVGDRGFDLPMVEHRIGA
jgi:uncharacterized protein YaeQ